MEKELALDTRVRTTQDKMRGDWVAGNSWNRAWGIEGKVIEVSRAHGLCYKVQPDNAGMPAAWYDYDEVEAV